MTIDFNEILWDIELKRAAALSTDQRPSIDVAAALNDTDFRAQAASTPELTVRDSDGVEQHLEPSELAAIVADALSVLSVAANEPVADTIAGRQLVRSTTIQVLRRLQTLNETKLARADLYALAQAAAIDAGNFDLAKALVVRRALLDAPGTPTGTPTDGEVLRLIRRNGEVVAWDTTKIATAIGKAFLSLRRDPAPACALAERVEQRARSLDSAYVEIETVQDLVQEELMLAGQMRVAERYIVYRAERAMLRASQRSGEPAEPVAIPVIEADGSESSWDGADLRARIAFAKIGLEIALDDGELENELRRSVRPGVRRADLQQLVVMNAKSLVERDSDFAKFAARILLTYIYEETLDWDILRDGVSGLRDAHRRALEPALRRGAQIGRIEPRLLEYDLDRLAAALDPTADLNFDVIGVQTLYDRYLIVDKTGKTPVRMEAPQLFWLRVAMGVCLGESEGEREARALDLYSVYKERRFCSSTPTLFNSGTQHPQLSSCFLYHVEDTLESIMTRGIADSAMCSKWAGGLGGSWTAVRGTGAHIASTNGQSQGVVPFLKIHNDQLVAVNQGGKRAGAGCAYLEIWHNDIREFLELRRNTGDERRRTHDMNTACWIPDLFMARMEARENWTLFRSSDVPDLHEIYGREFKERYEHYEQKAANGEISAEQIPAIDLWKQMLKMLFETGHPWITFKDPCNVRSPQDHAGVVHSSNLCTEITLNTGPDESAVCNLGSVVLDQHLTAGGELDLVKLRETVRIAVRALDCVIDVTFYPTTATRNANQRHRPTGLGVMGLQYALYRKGLAFDSPEAHDFSDEAMEAIAYYAYEASSDLAVERGRYSSYSGSKWDRGILPPDTVDLLEAERGEAIEVVRGGKLDWSPLRAKIAAQGMRNSNVLAIAPTATIANIMGTSPCIEPLYKNLFAKSNISGDFVILNPYLVADLKAAGMWNDTLATAIKQRDGDISELETIPAELRARYRTAFQLDAGDLIEAAARRQKWIDQSQSLNLFLGSPSMKVMSHMYRAAWRAGLKTTYYLRTLGASTIEKATVARVEGDSAAAFTKVSTQALPSIPGVAEAHARTSTTTTKLPLATNTDIAADADLSDETIRACAIDAYLNGGECEACQ